MVGPETLTSAFAQSPNSLSSPMPAPEIPEAGRAPAGKTGMSPEVEALVNHVSGGGTPPPMPGASQVPPSSVVPQQAPGAPTQFQGGAPLSVQEMASIGRTPEEQAQILARVYGAGNTMVQDGRVYFKRPGDSSFQPVSAEMGDFLKDVMHWDLGNAKMTGQSLIASHQTDLGTMAKALGWSVVGGAAGSLAGAPTIGAIAGSGLSVGYDSEQRSAAIDKLLQRKTDPLQVQDQATKDMAVDVVLNGTGAIIGHAIGAFGRGLQTLAEQAPMNRARTAVLLENELSNFADSLGSKGLSATGDMISGALDARKKMIGQMYIGKYDTMVEQLARDQNAKVPVDDVLMKMKDILQSKAGVEFNGMIPTNAHEAQIPNMSFLGQSREGGVSFEQLMNQPSSSQSLDTSLFSGIAPFGAKNGPQALQTILDDYSKLLQAKQAQGGLDVPVFRRMEQLYGNRGSYEMDNPFKDISTSVMNQIDKSFGDPAMSAQFSQDWAKYGVEKDAIKRLYDVFGQDKWTPELAIERALSTNNPKPIQDIKAIFGTNPDILGPLQGSVVQKALGDSINTRTGLPDLQKFAQNINAYNKSNPSVLDEIFNPADRRTLQAAVNRSAKVMTSDIS